MAILIVRHGSWWFPAVTAMLGESFQDWVPQWLGGGRFPWVLEVAPRRWGGTIPLVAQVVEGTVAGFTGGRRSGALRVGVSIGILEGKG